MKLIYTFLAVCLCLVGFAQSESASRRRNFNLDHDIALREFDPVSYFTGSPAKGSTKITSDYLGVTYCFVNEANRETFKKTPAKYEPAYGGWCAYSVAINGERVKSDPGTFKIVDGKLYLFYNYNGDNKLLKWNKNEKRFITSGDKFWMQKMH